MTIDKAALAQAGVVLPEVFEDIDLADRHAAVQVGAHIVRLGRRGVVHIAPDVAVVFFRLDFADRHAARVGGNGLAGAAGMHDLVDIFGPQVVLCLAFAVFAVSVDEQYTAVFCLTLGRTRLDLPEY